MNEREAADCLTAAALGGLNAAAVGHEEPQIEAVLGDRIDVEPLRHRKKIEQSEKQSNDLKCLIGSR
ncbi:MAG TPA: hypothetical protein VG826_34545 [Pirellulales bacterium]|nr:hypothetical protein [Pirellulales bacterium]